MALYSPHGFSEWNYRNLWYPLQGSIPENVEQEETSKDVGCRSISALRLVPRIDINTDLFTMSDDELTPDQTGMCDKHTIELVVNFVENSDERRWVPVPNWRTSSFDPLTISKVITADIVKRSLYVIPVIPDHANPLVFADMVHVTKVTWLKLYRDEEIRNMHYCPWCSRTPLAWCYHMLSRIGPNWRSMEWFKGYKRHMKHWFNGDIGDLFEIFEKLSGFFSFEWGELKPDFATVMDSILLSRGVALGDETSPVSVRKAMDSFTYDLMAVLKSPSRNVIQAFANEHGLMYS